MNTIIEKIKAEVERLKEENNNIRCDSNKAYCQGYSDAFVDLLPFLNTIQEQPIEDKEELSNFESALFSAFSDMWQSYMRGEEINVAEHVRRISPQLLIVASRQNKQPVSEGLKEETEKFIETFGWGKTKHLAEKELISATARHFAKWQKEKDDKELSEKIASAYQLGLVDKEKQMMKKAVEGELEYNYDEKGRAYYSIRPTWITGKIGDKVRIIIVKED